MAGPEDVEDADPDEAPFGVRDLVQLEARVGRRD
jgi:hypothetical protein